MHIAGPFFEEKQAENHYFSSLWNKFPPNKSLDCLIGIIVAKNGILRIGF
jgi:hypothetical protein